jgi:hypothetical protein
MGPDVNPNRQRINGNPGGIGHVQERTTNSFTHHFGVSRPTQGFSFQTLEPSQDDYVLDEFGYILLQSYWSSLSD